MRGRNGDTPMIYWWARVGQAVECVVPFPGYARRFSGGFLPVEGQTYNISKVGEGPNVVTGQSGIGVGLAEDPRWHEYGWSVRHFRPVWPQRLEELRRLAEGAGRGVGAPRKLEEA